MILFASGFSLKSMTALPGWLLFSSPFFLLESVPVWFFSIPFVLLI
jgi:hypothetical protein